MTGDLRRHGLIGIGSGRLDANVEAALLRQLLKARRGKNTLRGAVRAEEQLRHYVLTGTLLDSRLTVKQIVGLRFASDNEFAALAKRAADDNMDPEAIKKAVKIWRPDTYRA